MSESVAWVYTECAIDFGNIFSSPERRSHTPTGDSLCTVRDSAMLLPCSCWRTQYTSRDLMCPAGGLQVPPSGTCTLYPQSLGEVMKRRRSRCMQQAKLSLDLYTTCAASSYTDSESNDAVTIAPVCYLFCHSILIKQSLLVALPPSSNLSATTILQPTLRSGF